MKNLIRIVAIALMIFVFNRSEAQFRLGARAGMNVSTISFKTMGIELDPTAVVGFHIGLIGEGSLSDKLKVQPGILFSTKGASYSFGTEKMQINPQVIEIPVNLAYQLHSGNVGLSMYAGPYLAFGIAGTVEESGVSEDISYGSTDQDDLKGFDFGLNLGASASFGKFFLSAQYGFGLANLWASTTYDGTMKTGVFGLSLGYFFLEGK